MFIIENKIKFEALNEKGQITEFPFDGKSERVIRYLESEFHPESINIFKWSENNYSGSMHFRDSIMIIQIKNDELFLLDGRKRKKTLGLDLSTSNEVNKIQVHFDNI